MEPLVFGLDIGTRNVVGTVGYREDNEFIVVAQYIKEHDTRSMLDGQIHDIGRVAKTIAAVKQHLEEQIDTPLTEVCIAAAGRVLKTVTTTVEYQYEEESVVTGEDIHTLDLLGIEKASGILKEENDTNLKFYCVGYSVVKYYLNGDIFSNLEGHKAEVISEDIIVTFLPEDVVDGLYSACNQAGLEVANMTLEPIAAINVAIPEAFRMLNIALVDVGAGTSDISITRDGSIIAYGMIPIAGDEITEMLVQHYLVDFKTAEHIKLSAGSNKEIEFKDIMTISHTIPAKEVWDLTEDLVDRMATAVAEKIIALNGDKTVSATFVVGGGGKIHGFTEMLADKLELPYERVALRGEEVLQEVHFEQPDIQKDPLLVTPIGICLNYYDQKNNFILIHFNGERMKLYDNSKLTVVDAALQAGFPNDQLFPRRGKEINFTVNGRPRIIRGQSGESAVVKMDGRVVSINTPLEPNCEIVIESSTVGEDAAGTIEQLEEYTESTIVFEVNRKTVVCPRFVEVNGILEPPTYQIQEGDAIETRSYYTLGQLIEFMDVELDMDRDILVNNRDADMATLVYENFSVEWTVLETRTHIDDMEKEEAEKETGIKEGGIQETGQETGIQETGIKEAEENAASETAKISADAGSDTVESETSEENSAGEDEKKAVEDGSEEEVEETKEPKESSILVTVNKEPITMSGKRDYIYVDVFEYIDFNLNDPRGRNIVTKLNGENAEYMASLKNGDVIDIYWEETK